MKLNLNQKLAEIQANLKAKKSRYNGFGKYNFIYIDIYWFKNLRDYSYIYNHTFCR